MTAGDEAHTEAPGVARSPGLAPLQFVFITPLVFG